MKAIIRKKSYTCQYKARVTASGASGKGMFVKGDSSIDAAKDTVYAMGPALR